MSLTAAVWPQFATRVFRGGIGRLTCLHNFRKLCKLGQLWMQVASVHHEYGRLTLATAGLLFLLCQLTLSRYSYSFADK